jgi:hypothetical protein
MMITEVSRMNAGCSRDAVGAARELVTHADDLQKMVGRFTVAA